MEKIIQYCSSRQNVYVYGAGYYGKVMYAYLRDKNVSVAGFIVSNKHIHKMQLFNIRVYSMAEYAGIQMANDGIILGVDDIYHEDIVSILISFGIRDFLVLKNNEFNFIERRTKFFIPKDLNRYVCVLCYHRVGQVHNDIWNLGVSPLMFEAHVKYLKEHYRILSTVEDWSDVKVPSVVITFDDGYYDCHKNLLPILKKYMVPATIFVCTGNLNTDKEFWWDELEGIVFSLNNDIKRIRFVGRDYVIHTDYEKKKTLCYELHSILKNMTPNDRQRNLNKLKSILNSKYIFRKENRSLTSDELINLAKSSLVTIGGHTITHNVLSKESEEDQTNEIYGSKSAIEQFIQAKINTFSYPFGGGKDFSAVTRGIAEKAGYTRIFSAYGGLAGSSCSDIPRNGVPGDANVSDLARIIRKAFCLFGE